MPKKKNTEIELKFLEINPSKVRGRLLKLGAKHSPEELQKINAFDFPDYRLEKQKAVLRLRREHGKTMLCFKKLQKSKKARQMREIQTEVSSFEKTKQLLEAIGLKLIGDKEKKRESFKLGKTSLEIDTFPGIPSFLEIEAENSKEIEKTARLLGISMKKATKMRGEEVLKHYLKDKYSRIWKFQ